MVGEVHTILKRGDQVRIDKESRFGKISEVIATVVMVKGNKVLLDTGDEVPRIYMK